MTGVMILTLRYLATVTITGDRAANFSAYGF
jgi:hypothetical protein